jgi:hypothetical protein
VVALLDFPVGGDHSPLLLSVGGAASAPDFCRLEEWTYWEGDVDVALRSTAARTVRPFALFLAAGMPFFGPE